MDRRTRLVQSRRRSMVLLRSISPTSGSPVFILVLMFHHQSALLSLGIAIEVRQATSALFWKKERKFSKKYLWSYSRCSRSSQKNALSGAFKKASKTLSKPKAPWLESLAPNLSKARETKKLFETDKTLERKEIVSSFERKLSLESLAQNNLEVDESLPRPQLVIPP